MPEGDTIHKAANRLRPALLDRVVTRFEAPRVAGSRPRPGATITEVEAVGKHLLIRFDDGHVLRTHLRMTGRWDLYAPGERWRKPPYLARAIIEVEGAVAVCFSAPVVEVIRSDRASDALPGTAHLGPDLCRADADLAAVVERMAQIPEAGTAIADVLLDQRVAAGVGNVFKSEICWAEKVNPLTPIEQVPVELRERLVATAAKQLRANVTTRRRTTVAGPPGSVAVYGKARRPCRRCGTPVVMRRTGPQNRSTYWCPRCQPAPAAPATATDRLRDGKPRAGPAWGG